LQGVALTRVFTPCARKKKGSILCNACFPGSKAPWFRPLNKAFSTANWILLVLGVRKLILDAVGLNIGTANAKN
jgi:hypothetical protein